MTGTGDSRGHVFISYVREDSGMVSPVVAALEAAGILVWRDTADLRPGQDWRLAIRNAIAGNTRVFLACLSSYGLAKERSYQREELILAIEEMRLRSPDTPWLIPVRLDECPVPDWNPGAGRTLARLQCVDLFGERREEQMSRLVAAVQQALGPARLVGARLSRPAPPFASVLLTGARAAPHSQDALDTRWQAGEEGWLGGRRYVLQHDKSGLLRADRDSGGQVRRQALARQTDPEPEPGRRYVWLRQGGKVLTRERDLLTRARPVPGLPKVAHHEAVAGLVALALSWPAEKQGLPCETVQAKFTLTAPNEWQVHLLLEGLASLTRPLGELHRLKTSHRNLAPDGIIDAGNKKFALRDTGLAATGNLPGEGPESYQAPEQAYGARMAKPGPATDVYQLAAIAYHLIAGRLPSGRNPPPARHEGLADPATDIISAALAGNPADRPHLHEFGAALRSPPPRGRQKP